MTDNITRQVPQAVRHIPCEVYSRIVGYLRPVQAWNEGKQQEFQERETYDMQRCLSPEEAPEATPSANGG